MVGVARSKRCEQCKRRRCKCDEQWPICGSCQKLKQKCSGPPAAFGKFIAHDSNGTVGAMVQSGQDTPKRLDIGILETANFRDSNGHPPFAAVRQRTAPTGGGLFIRMRQSPTIYPSLASSGADAFARKMANVLSSVTGTKDDIALRAGWIHLVPSRLSRSSALWHAADLFIHSWTRAMKEPLVDVDAALDTKYYNKAISALRKEMNDSDKAFSTETLAAVALIHICEDEFGNQVNCHALGLQTIMGTRGLPKIQDELDVRVAFESIGNLLINFIIGDEPGFLRQPEWRRTMEDALGSKSVLDAQTRQSYGLNLLLARWPGLAHRLRRIGSLPQADVGLAVGLATDATELTRDLASLEQKMLLPLLQDSRHVSVVPDKETPYGLAYMFTEWTTCELLLLHCTASLAVHHIRLSVLQLSGCETSQNDTCLEELSRRVWMSVQYVMQQAPTARLSVVAPLVLSLEHAEPEDQELLASLVPGLLGKRRAAAWPSCSVPALLVVSRLLTGRPLT